MARRVVIACDLGGTTATAAVVDSSLEVRHEVEVPAAGLSYAHVVELLAGAVADLRAREPAVHAIGCSVAGRIDRRRGTVTQLQTSSWETVPVRRALRDAGDRSVVLDNDGACAVLAEHRAGAAKGCRDVVMLTVGTRLATGLVRGGRIDRTRTGDCPQLGDLLATPAGPSRALPVGRLVGGDGLELVATRLAHERRDSRLGELARGGEQLSGAVLARLAEQGDEDAREVFAETGFFLGALIASAVNLFVPQVVVLGGGALLSAGEHLLAPARQVVERWLLAPGAPPPLRPAAFGSRAGLVGAALLALEER